MKELALVMEGISMLAGALISTGLPPFTSGAFWSIVAFYGVVSILFDDETPRGIPGIEYLHAKQPRTN